MRRHHEARNFRLVHSSFTKGHRVRAACSNEGAFRKNIPNHIYITIFFPFFPFWQRRLRLKRIIIPATLFFILANLVWLWFQCELHNQANSNRLLELMQKSAMSRLKSSTIMSSNCLKQVRRTVKLQLPVIVILPFWRGRHCLLKVLIGG